MSSVSSPDRAYWTCGPGAGELRPVAVPVPGPGEVLVRTVASGISRGTERLVLAGRVPRDRHADMRAPFQDGDFPWPVKYGYLNVGIVEQGPAELTGRIVFCLYPHQTRYVVPAAAVTVVPPGVPARRAVLAGTVETAVNALWDAPAPIGSRVVVLGAGAVGCCVARLLAGMPGVDVTLADVDDARASVAAALGVAFSRPEHAPGERDLVVHASATAAGLNRALELLRTDGTVVELSWYGDAEVPVALGGAFHARRLTIRSSQVGTVSPRVQRSAHERLSLALDLLRDPAYDALLAGDWRFAELPDVMSRLASGHLPAGCHTVRYDEEPACSA